MPLPGMGGRLTAEQILGMSTDDFKKKMEGAASKDDVTSLQTKLDETGSALSAIQASLAKLTTPPPVPDPVATGDQDDPTTALLTDPAGFVRRAGANTEAVALQARADVLEMRARNENAGIFGKYGKEIAEAAKTYNLQSRCQEGFWNFLINSFLGGKMRSGDIDAGSYPSLLGSSTVAGDGTMARDTVDPNHGFTADQAAFFKEQGVPLAEAAQIQKLMAVDQEPIDMQRWKERVRREHAA